jgi:hypothetical protein
VNSQDSSSKIFLCVHLSNLASSSSSMSQQGTLATALVYKVGSRSFDVLIRKFGIENRCWIEDLVTSGEVTAIDYDKDTFSLTIYWNIAVIQKLYGIKKVEDSSSSSQTKDEIELNVAEDDGDDSWTTDDEVDSKPESNRDMVFSSAGTKVVSNWSSKENNNGKSTMLLPKSSANPFISTPEPTTTTRRLKRSEINLENTLIQKISLFQFVPVRILSDIQKSPPVIKVLPGI